MRTRPPSSARPARLLSLPARGVGVAVRSLRAQPTELTGSVEGPQATSNALSGNLASLALPPSRDPFAGSVGPPADAKRAIDQALSGGVLDFDAKIVALTADTL